jgi:hypothetical protein
MTRQNLNQRLIINDHFDDIINQIDIKTETLLEEEAKFNKKSKLESGADDRRNKLNEIRDKQIEKIKEIKQINLNLLQNNEQEEELELDLEKLIHFDCALLEEPKSKNGLVLWITSGFYNKEDLEFLR